MRGFLVWAFAASLAITAQAADKQPAYAPQAEDSQLRRGNAFVESVTGGKGELKLSGNLPTSCHKLRLTLDKKLDSRKRLVLQAWSVSDPKMMCAQMLQPFTVSVPVDKKIKRGSYVVVVNGQESGRVELK
jgi:hypothetical protein